MPARDQVRIASQQAQRGAAWLAINPSVGLGTELNNDECRLLLRFWLGAPLVPAQWQGAACPLCGQVLDVLGDHVVCCNKNNLKQRHVVQEADKNRPYVAKCRQQGYSFAPFVVSPWGD